MVSLAGAMSVTDVPMLRTLLISMESDGHIIYQRGSGSPDNEKVWSKAAVESSNDGDSVDGEIALSPSNGAVEASLASDTEDTPPPVAALHSHNTRRSARSRPQE